MPITLTAGLATGPLAPPQRTRTTDTAPGTHLAMAGSGLRQGTLLFGRVPVEAVEGHEPDQFYDVRMNRPGLSGLAQMRRRLQPTVPTVGTTGRHLVAVPYRPQPLFLPSVRRRRRSTSGLGQLAPSQLTDRIFRLSQAAQSTQRIARDERLVREQQELEYVRSLIGMAMNWAAAGDDANATSVIDSAERELENIRARIARAAQTPRSFFGTLTQGAEAAAGAATGVLDLKKWLLPAGVVLGVLLLSRR